MQEKRCGFCSQPISGHYYHLSNVPGAENILFDSQECANKWQNKRAGPRSRRANKEALETGEGTYSINLHAVVKGVYAKEMQEIAKKMGLSLQDYLWKCVVEGHYKFRWEDDEE